MHLCGPGAWTNPLIVVALALSWRRVRRFRRAHHGQALTGYRLLVLRVPTLEFKADERAAIVDFVRKGGSLMLAFDEERRAPLATTGVNDLIAPFGMKLTDDTEYLHNNGAIAKKGTIHVADREVPFSGGRAVEGGTPFAWQLDKDGKQAQVFAASTTVGTTGRVVVLGDAMATLFLGTPEGVRLTGVPRDPTRTTYWGGQRHLHAGVGGLVDQVIRSRRRRLFSPERDRWIDGRGASRGTIDAARPDATGRGALSKARTRRTARR